MTAPTSFEVDCPALVAGVPALVAGLPALVAGVPALVAGVPALVAGVPVLAPATVGGGGMYDATPRPDARPGARHPCMIWVRGDHAICMRGRENDTLPKAKAR